MRRSVIFGFGLVLILAACAGRRGPEPVTAPDGTPAARVGAGGMWVAEPVALLAVSFDKDGDGLTTTIEREAGLRALWPRADADGSGVLSPLEFNAWRAIWLGNADGRPGHVTFDRNVDNRITAEEFMEGFERELRHFDKDGDGALSRGELVRFIAAPQGRGPGGGPPGGGRGRGRPPG